MNATQTTPTTKKQRPKTIYNLVEKDGQTTWTPIGVAWINRDGSLNCTLDVMPKEGKLHIRDSKPRVAA